MSTAPISRHAERPQPRDHPVHHRLENLHHRRDDDQCADRVPVDRGGPRQGGGGASISRRSRRRSTRSPAFGIAPDRVFGFWDWVGGRYSLWSAIGLPVMIAIGPENFRAFLDGAHEMDTHFRSAPMLENIPMVMGLIGYWHRVVCGFRRAPSFRTTSACRGCRPICSSSTWNRTASASRNDGTPVTTPTGPLVWGEPGTNGQHAFFQLLHQGTDVIPVEFLVGGAGARTRTQAPSRAAARQLPGAVGRADEGPHAGRGAAARC